MQVSSEISPYGICTHKHFLLVPFSPYNFYGSFIVIISFFVFFGVEGNGSLSCGILNDLRTALYHGTI